MHMNPDIRFIFDEAKARAFLARSLRRYAGTLEEGEGDGAGRYENWQLEPGWDLEKIFETGHIKDLIYQATREAGVITCTDPDVELDLAISSPISTPLGDEWTYQWQVNFAAGAGFAVCTPDREFRKLGWHDGTIRAKGIRTAFAVLREAEAEANQLAEAFAAAARQASPSQEQGEPA